MNGEVVKNSFHSFRFKGVIRYYMHRFRLIWFPVLLWLLLEVRRGPVYASVFTRNTRRLLFIRKVEKCSVIGIPRLLSLRYIVNGGARLELTLKISLIGIEFYIFFNCFLFGFLLNIHV
jgi:hypothetical protein